LESLKNENKKIKCSAIEALRQFPNPNVAIITALLDALKDREGEVRQDAVEALGRLPNPEETVIKALLDALKDEDRYVRGNVVTALSQFPNPSEAIIKAFGDALKDREWEVIQSAVKALGRLPNPSEDIITALLNALLKSKVGSAQLNVRAAFGQLPNFSEAIITGLLETLKDEDKYVRENAVGALRFPNPSDAIITALLEALKDKSRPVEIMYVIYALGTLCSRSSNFNQAIIPVLLDFLKDKDQYNKKAALKAFHKFLFLPEDIIPALLDALKDGEWEVRRYAVEALGRFPNPSDAIITALLKALKDREWEVRQKAAEALGRLSNPIEAIITALLEALRDEDRYVRGSVVEALGQFPNPRDAVITALSDALKDRNLEVRRKAAEALGRLPNPRPAIITVLLDALKDRELEVRRNVVEALSQLSNSNEIVIPTLLDFLKKNNQVVEINNGINYSFTNMLSHLKTDQIEVVFERLIYHPLLLVYLLSYFRENHLLCIDHEKGQVFLSLYNKIHKISFSREILIHLEKQVRSVAEQLHYPLNILLNDKSDEEQSVANSIAKAGLNDALMQTRSHGESKADSDCPIEKDTLLEKQKDAEAAQREHVEGRFSNQEQNGRMSAVASIDHKNLQTPAMSSNSYSYWNNKKPQPLLGFGVKRLEQLLWNSSLNSNPTGNSFSSLSNSCFSSVEPRAEIGRSTPSPVSGRSSLSFSSVFRTGYPNRVALSSSINREEATAAASDERQLFQLSPSPSSDSDVAE
jgi:HEAT repeat protein